MTLGDLLFVVSDDTMVVIINNETQDQIFSSRTCDDMRDAVYEYEDADVMDINVWDNIMYICIEV